jgi:hypothetical protein
MTDESATEEFKVTVQGDGIAVDRAVDQAKARAVLDILLGGEAAVGQRTPAAKSGGSSTGSIDLGSRNAPRISLREFLEDAEAKRNPDKIVVIAEYLVEFEGMRDVGKEDIKGRFRTAGEPSPANFSRDFAWAIQSGWLAEDSGNPGRFYVTRKGKDAIAQKFVSDVRRALRQTPSRRRRLRHPRATSPAD